jgi:hypothetical protein
MLSVQGVDAKEQTLCGWIGQSQKSLFTSIAVNGYRSAHRTAKSVFLESWDEMPAG